MLKYKHIIFDLDGTISDPSAGIENGIRYAFQKMEVVLPASFDVRSIIGLPLQVSLKEFFHTEQRRWQAINFFREYYAEKGLFENRLYPGVSSILYQLSELNGRLYIATNKPQPFAEKIVNYFNIRSYFTKVSGITEGKSSLFKDELVRRIIEEERIKKLSEVVLIGDTFSDIICGKKNEINTVAVGYGFGSRESLLRHFPTYFISSIHEVKEILVQKKVDILI